MNRIKKRVISLSEPQMMGEMPRKKGIFNETKNQESMLFLKKACHFKRQRENFFLNHWDGHQDFSQWSK